LISSGGQGSDRRQTAVTPHLRSTNADFFTNYMKVGSFLTKNTEFGHKLAKQVPNCKVGLINFWFFVQNLKKSKFHEFPLSSLKNHDFGFWRARAHAGVKNSDNSSIC